MIDSVVAVIDDACALAAQGNLKSSAWTRRIVKPRDIAGFDTIDQGPIGRHENRYRNQRRQMAPAAKTRKLLQTLHHVYSFLREAPGVVCGDADNRARGIKLHQMSYRMRQSAPLKCGKRLEIRKNVKDRHDE
jgi:hypothetical protein